MVSPHPQPKLSSFSPNTLLLWSFFFSLSFLLLGKGNAAAEGKQSLHHHHHLQISSLLPSTVCNHPPASIGQEEDNPSLTVVHRHGPCNPLRQPVWTGAAAAAQMLAQDQSRVDSIHSKLSKNRSSTGENFRDSKATLPANSGSVIGSGNFIVTVGLGTPKRDLSLIFDTGSDLTWTQCRPCVGSCYSQKEQIFDPLRSTSYSNISCTSPLCSQLTSGTGSSPRCSGPACVYGIQYGDQSFSAGFFGKERLSLTRSDVVEGFLFGCGQNNQGLFGGSAGLLGLGRDKLSLVYQSAQKYGRVFSYCLPSSPRWTGSLTFGSTAVSKATRFTPLLTNPRGPSFYFLDLTAIGVGGQKLDVPAAVFSTGGTIIDSGTVITRLPPTAYAALRTAFRKLMSKYPEARALSILDTCYDLSGYETVTVPKITLYMGGGVGVEVDKSGVVYAASVSQVCLAFAGNGDDSDMSILGNVQQQTLDVVYDVAHSRVGFGVGGCA